MLELLPYFAVAIIVPLCTQFAHQYFPIYGQGVGGRALLNPFDAGAMAVLIGFAGTRSNIGRDYSLYSNVYNRLVADDWSGSIERSPQEVGFTLFSLALKSTGLSAQGFLFVISALTVFAVYVAIRIASPSPAFSVLLYILFAGYLSPMNTARQGLAIAFMLLAVVLVRQHRVVAILLVFLACVIHTSAIIALALFLLMRYLSIGIFALIITIAVAAGAGSLLPLFPGLIDFLGGLNERYETYLTSGAQAGVGTIIVSAIHAVLALSFIGRRDYSEDEKWWTNIYTLTSPLALVGTAVLVASRVSDYTAILLPLVASFATLRFKSPELARWALASLGVVYYVGYLLNYGDLLPYQSWLLQSL